MALLWRLRRRCEDNIEVDQKDVGYEDMGWIHLAQSRDLWRTLAIVITFELKRGRILSI
jgi:hypothetical protein